jgi:hypothetical protein
MNLIESYKLEMLFNLNSTQMQKTILDYLTISPMYISNGHTYCFKPIDFVSSNDMHFKIKIGDTKRNVYQRVKEQHGIYLFSVCSLYHSKLEKLCHMFFNFANTNNKLEGKETFLFTITYNISLNDVYKYIQTLNLICETTFSQMKIPQQINKQEKEYLIKNNLPNQTSQIDHNKLTCQACGKIYKHKQSLSAHKHTCKAKDTNMTEIIKTQILKELEQSHQLSQIINNNYSSSNNSNNTTNTSNNKKMYKCENCKFCTNKSTDYKRHLETKKHLLNIDKNKVLGKNDQPDNKKFVCTICGKKYKHNSTLSAHKQICKAKNTNIIETIKTQILKELEQSHQLPLSIVTNNDYSTNNSNNITSTSNTTLNDNKIINNNKTINVVSYINSHYANTEPLKPICQEKITQMIIMKPEEQGNHTFCEFLVYNHDKKILDEFLGRIITDAYKKKNPAEQQFWATDVARLTFVVRQVLNTNDIWLTNKKGTQIINYIIDPFLDELLAMLVDHIKKCRLENLKSNVSNDNLEKNSNQIFSSKKIILDIANKDLHQKILKQITPQFQIKSTLSKIN